VLEARVSLLASSYTEVLHSSNELNIAPSILLMKQAPVLMHRDKAIFVVE
jgi:hypothetical protein